MGMGYDRMTGFATAAGGLAVGFTAGAVNFYTTGVAQMITGLPLYSGLSFRLFSFVILVAITIAYVLLYAKKVKAHPEKSIVSAEYQEQLAQSQGEADFERLEFTPRQKIALLGLVAVLIVSVYGAINLGWAMAELSAMYIIYAIFLVIVLGLKPNEAAANFGKGAMRLLPAALAIGFARSVVVLMNQAKIVDTAVHGLAQFLNNKPMVLSLLIICLAIIIFNFFVVSGSGKAMILMPILSPLAKILGINQQIMVILYQFGDGPTNYFWPTSGGLMGALGLSNVRYEDWVHFSWKLVILWQIAAFILIMIANALNLGPF